MRAIIYGTSATAEVIGEAFSIPGCGEEFIVHRSLVNRPRDLLWVATHLLSSFAVGYGDTADEAIAHGRERWLERTPEQIEKALERAYALTAERKAQRAA